MASTSHQDSHLDFAERSADEKITCDALAGRAPGESPPTLDLRSDSPLPDPQREQAAAPATTAASAGLWLDGDALMCGCPDCHAPMSVRLWLMTADCWRCGTSIELTEQQQREAQQLLEQRPPKESPRPHGYRPQAAEPSAGLSAAAAPARTAARSPTAPSHKPAHRVPHPPKAPTPPPAPGQPPDRKRTPPRHRPQTINPRRQRLQSAQATAMHAWLRRLLQDTPAWLVSLVFHLVLLTLLGLLRIDDQDDGPYILLSMVVDRNVRPGGDIVHVERTEDSEFDLPLPSNVDWDDPEERESLLQADQEAQQLRLDPNEPHPHLPQIEQVRHAIQNASGLQASLAARDPRVRVEMVQREGGTTLTEAAVARALRWLAEQQRHDGSWELDGHLRSDSGATSLALLPFLGAGQTHLVGQYQDTVSRGLRWMIENQREDGDLRARSQGNTGMYAHGQATIVLCEAFLLTGDESLRVPAQKSIDFIVEAQHTAGGWRYQPNQPGDTSVLGWPLMALQSARAANLTVPSETLELAGHFLDSVAHDGGALYAYMPGHGPTHVMTSEALLCRMYLGWNMSDRPLIDGMQYLLDNHPPKASEPNFYYWYYATQAFKHYGGPPWDEWNRQMREILVSSQEKAGRHAGSWPPRGPHAAAGGRLYVTSLAACTLEVYYRHLPLFRQIDLELPQ